MQPGFQRAEQWQAQIQSLISKRARILLHSNLPPESVRAAHLTPCANVSMAVDQELARLGEDGRIAVLPQGPLTIPYLRNGESLCDARIEEGRAAHSHPFNEE